VISIRDIVFNIIKRYNPNNNLLVNIPEIIQTLEILSLDINNIINDWEILPPPYSFETTVNKHGDTIIINETIENH